MPVRIPVEGLIDFEAELVNLATATIEIVRYRCIGPDGRDISVERSALKVRRMSATRFDVVWWPEGAIKKHGIHRFVFELRVDGMPYDRTTRVNAVDPIDHLRRPQ